MAIGAIYQGAGFTEAQYNQVHQLVTPSNQAPSGLIYHAAGPSENGFCVVEVWESQEALQRFFEQQLGKALQDAGINVQPVFFQVANVMQR